MIVVPPLADIKLTDHARERMAEMGVDRRQIRRILVDPAVVTPANAVRDKFGDHRERSAHTDNLRLFTSGEGIAVVANVSELPKKIVIVTLLERTTDLYERP